MLRRVLILMILSVVGCQKSSPTTPSLASAASDLQVAQQVTPGATAEVATRPKTVEEEEAEREASRLEWAYSDDGARKSQAEYRLLAKADRDAIDELQALVRKRPLVEMSADQRALHKQRKEFFIDRTFGRYFLDLAERDGGRQLTRLLKLSDYNSLEFRFQYAQDDPARRLAVRAAITKVAENGFGPLTDSERACLRPYKEYLDELRD